MCKSRRFNLTSKNNVSKIVVSPDYLVPVEDEPFSCSTTFVELITDNLASGAVTVYGLLVTPTT